MEGEAMKAALRILNLEDDALDTDLALAILRKDGLAAEIDRVDTHAGFEEALRRGGYSLIVADYSIPGMDALEALRLAREVRPEVPFIFLSGALGEETAIEMLKLGASDYVLKQRLERLVPAVRRALRESEEHAHRKQAEDAFARERNLLRTLIDNLPDCVYVKDTQSRFLAANLAIAHLMGAATVSDVLGKSDADFYPPEIAAEYRADEEELLRSGQPLVNKDEPHRDVNGDLRAILTTKVPLRDGQGKIVGLVGITHDITEIKQAEERLRDSEQQFRALADSIPNLAWWANGDGYITWYNRQWYEYTGTTPEQMEGWGWQSVHDPGELPRVLERWKVSLATREPFNMEFPLRGRDGQFRWFLTRGVPLKDASGRVVRWFGTNTDVTEVRQARQAAEAANEAKGRFLANISHELRTPMNAILGLVDLALPKQADPTTRDFLQTAKESADLLLALLNDLLDSAKIEAGNLELESAPFSLGHVLDQTAQVLSVRASEKGISFSCHIAPEVPDGLIGDQVRLRQVLLNLAGNAIKFTERGEVTVSVRVESQGAEEACLEFAVQDTGIGISRSDLERLFRPFTQADPSMARRFGGTGLGLAICSNLVRLMGGRIRVESSPGQGSTFYVTVRLPLAKQVPPEPETPDVLPAATSKLRILLAEDNPANQKLATYVLQDRGHTVEIAGDGQQAIRMVRENRYDVILMDVQMPGMDGLEATKVIRAGENDNRRVPIIAMTAHAMQGDREWCLAAGMDDYLSKPIDAHEMIVLIESLATGTAPVAPQRAATAPMIRAAAAVFDPELALKQCFDKRDLLQEIIGDFFKEADNFLPQIRAALQKGDLVEVGRLGHRLKGTITHVGAEAAGEAASRVERFLLHAGEQTEAEEAVRALERECEVLRAALTEYQGTNNSVQGGK